MLIGYVSDERYVAVPEVLCEFIGAGGSYEARSRASGAVYADLDPGTYEVVLTSRDMDLKGSSSNCPWKSPTIFAFCAMGCWGICGLSGYREETSPNSGSTLWKPTS